jgi:adenylate kinase
MAAKQSTKEKKKIIVIFHKIITTKKKYAPSAGVNILLALLIVFQPD